MFDIVRRGYDCAQVDYQLEQLRADLRIAVADRDAAVTQAAELARTLEAARGEIDDLRAQLKRLAAPPTTVEGMSERVARMLQTAQHEAAEIIAKATTAAAAIRAGVEREAEGLRTLRHQLTGQLQSVSRKLDEALRHLSPAPEEDDGPAGEQAQRV